MRINFVYVLLFCLTLAIFEAAADAAKVKRVRRKPIASSSSSSSSVARRKLIRRVPFKPKTPTATEETHAKITTPTTTEAAPIIATTLASSSTTTSPATTTTTVTTAATSTATETTTITTTEHDDGNDIAAIKNEQEGERSETKGEPLKKGAKRKVIMKTRKTLRKKVLRKKTGSKEEGHEAEEEDGKSEMEEEGEKKEEKGKEEESEEKSVPKRRRVKKPTAKIAKRRGARFIEGGVAARQHDYYDHGEYYQMIRHLPGVHLIEDRLQSDVAPYSVDAHDLLALESHQQFSNNNNIATPTTPSKYEQIPAPQFSYDEQLAQPYLDSQEPDQQQKQVSTIQQQSFAYDFEKPLDFVPKGNQEFQDKTITEVRDALGGLLRSRQQQQAIGPDGRPVEQEDNTLVRAALPVALVGFVALAFSSIFANRQLINSTSNEENPWLYHIPINFNGDAKKRRKRGIGAEDEEDYFNEIGNDYQDSEEGILEVSSKYVQRFKDGILLYSMVEADPDCRMKIACIFGERTRRSDHRSLIQSLVRTLMPKYLRDFTDEFLLASSASAVTRRDGENQCSQWKCAKCFSV